MTTSSNPVVVNQPVTLTATVSGSTLVTSTGTRPTGMVTFYDGSANIGSIAVGSSGIVQLPVTFKTAGSHSLQAVYSGDSTFAGSTGTVTQSVTSTQTTPHVSLSSSTSSPVVGQPITFTVSLPSGATGSVTLLDGKSSLGSATLANGSATFTISSLGVGQH